MLEDKDLVSVQQARQLVEKAYQAAQRFRNFSQEQTDRVVQAMAQAAERQARRLAELAVEETGYGKVQDKTVKNLFAAVDVYRYIRNLKTCDVIGENREKKVIEIAVPSGVIAAIIPSTNPTSTAIFKILCALKGRNTIVLSPHPHALRCTIETARVMEEAARQAGAPEGSIGWMETVTLEGTSELMRHRRTALILATGGAGLVRAAYSSGKPAYGVGPGNVPAFIERTADVPKAVRDILAGKTFDHGVLCSSEQALVCDLPIESQVLEELRKGGGYFLDPAEQEKLERLIQLPNKRLNPAVVGKSPQVIAAMAGFSVPDGVVCLVGRAAGVGPDFPLSMEKLSPILAFYVEDGWEAGCERCIEILNFGGLGHTMAIHSRDQHVILQFGLYKPAYRICVNTPATHGSIGLTTGVPPSMTLGCGTPGGNITSDNITPLHLINIKRLAFETRPVDQLDYSGLEQSSQPSLGLSPVPAGRNVQEVIQRVVGDFLRERGGSGEKPAETPAAVPSAPAFSPPHRIDRPAKEPQWGPPVEFVCEEDVRVALRRKQKIVINEKTIITPSARDLGADKSIFIMADS